MKINAPVSKNQQITLEITDITLDGQGIGHFEGFTVFVPATVTEDIVKIVVVKVTKNYAFGKVLEIVTPAPCRINSECKCFPKCGGCTFQHISYDAELKIKEKVVKDNFSRIGKIDTPVLPIIGFESTENYRNKAIFPIEFDVNTGKNKFGFYAKNSHRIVEIDNCKIHSDIFSQIATEIVKICDDFSIDYLRNIYIRQGHYSREIMVCLVVSRKRAVRFFREFFQNEGKTLLDKFPDIKSVIVNINQNDGNVVLGDKSATVFGKSEISDTICGNIVQISPKSFYQINTPQAEKLYEIGRIFADIKPTDVIFDLYCGIGTIALYLSKFAKKVIGLEVVPQAIENAENNAKINNISNVSFKCEDMSTYKFTENADIIFLDPPRKGCGAEIIENISRQNTEKVVMISCNPATAARDCNYFTEFGYEVKKIQPVDMFPRTGHIEVVILLEKVK
jgi:23S rRNA (uracil1939-C5)-methyltransferase